jgi:hypothetical protein
LASDNVDHALDVLELLQQAPLVATTVARTYFEHTGTAVARQSPRVKALL